MSYIVLWLVVPLLVPVAIAVHQLCLAVYNVFFHPLRKFPGDFQDRASHFRGVKNMISWDTANPIFDLHKKYGTVVRVNPDELSFSSPEAWKDIYHHKAGGEPELPKDGEQYIQGSGLIVNILFAQHAEHRKLRRIMGPGFAEKALVKQEQQVQHLVDLYIEGLRNRSGENDFPNKEGIVDISKWHSFFSYDMICYFMFGRPAVCMRNGEADQWPTNSRAAVRMSAYLGALSRLWPYSWILEKILLPPHMSKGYYDHLKFAEKAGDDRLEKPVDNTDDWVSFMIRGTGDIAISKLELTDNINILLPAATESTGGYLDTVVWYLIQNPEWYQKAVDECRDTHPLESDISLKSTAELKILRAITNEAIRMHPPIPTALPRVVPKGGRMIAGSFVPEGLACYRTEAHFKNPDTYAPQRWLEDPEYKDDLLDAMNPFNTGPRTCIAERFARGMTRVLLCRLLYNFDIKMMPGNPDIETCQDEVGLWFSSPIKVQLTTRSRG